MLVPGSGRASPPQGAGGRVRVSGLTLMELSIIIVLFSVIATMALAFVNNSLRLWQADRLALNSNLAAGWAMDALDRFYVGEYCPFGATQLSGDRDFTTAEFYSDVLEPYVDEDDWARLIRNLPGGDAPRDFFTGRLTRPPATPPFAFVTIQARWGGYDPVAFGVPGPAMAARAGATWDFVTSEIIWERILSRRGSKIEALRRFLRENSGGRGTDFGDPEICL